MEPGVVCEAGRRLDWSGRQELPRGTYLIVSKSLEEVGVDAEGGLDRAHLVDGESVAQAAPRRSMYSKRAAVSA